jgi:bacillithiol biosynthesis deacetylase BshB2
MSAKQILVVLAHPDDETFICGGTLARYAAQGVRITLVCATRGEMGRRLGVPPFATRETLPIVREHELRAACEPLGIADLRLLGLRDKTVDYYAPALLAARIAEIIHEVQPDVVITFHDLVGGHPDHCAIGRATRLAYEQTGVGRLYFLLWKEHADHLTRVGATPARVTAIKVEGAAAEAKVKAYRAHRTQSQRMDWLWGDDQKAARQVSGEEFFLQGSGPVRPGEKDLLP